MKTNILSLIKKTTAFFGGHAQNRTGIKGFAILCVTIPPRGHIVNYLNHLLILIKQNLIILGFKAFDIK
jgi:hypothetical protein